MIRQRVVLYVNGSIETLSLDHLLDFVNLSSHRSDCKDGLHVHVTDCSDWRPDTA